MRVKVLFKKIVVLFICATLPGCGFKDIDKRFFVVAMGIDWTGKKDHPYLITLRLAIPTSKIGEGLAESQIEQTEAKSIAEAVRILKSHVDKEIDFGQCKMFVFGDSLVKQSLEEPLNWLNRRRDIQLISYMALAKPNANTLLKAKPASERLAGNSFFLTFGKEGTVSPYTVTEQLFDSFRRFSEKGLDPYFPVVFFDGDSYVVQRLSLLDKKNEKLVLNPRETKLYNLTANAFAKSGIPIDYKGKRLAFYVSRASTNVSITKGAVPTVHLKLKISGLVEQSPVTLTPQSLKEVQLLLQENVNRTGEQLLIKIRDANIDPYGFGLHYLAQYFGDDKDWSYWKKIYPDVKFVVTTRIKIESTGLIR
ncbi:Ger(x)C family spore germination protein [Paenibacillus rhizovicinus]|uniref:Ger(X)C family spore germination protein n=1 Tax=Paenibacillus rhizovicinus TaxID=2704463 RepID=A0A6C0NY64_9BACL|nr:Ger(x)C family spore germination protein [Paenibacillus rhizovicinus]QHW31129.1 Ger(x)C family spore germination protein [Paenibacillus rhizovicinus]